MKTIINKGKKKAVRLIFGRSAVIILLLLIQFLMLFTAFFKFENYLTVAYGGITVTAVITVLYIASTQDNPSVRLSWTALVVIAPVFGALLYIFIHAELGHRIMNRRLSKVLQDTAELSVQDEKVLTEVKKQDKILYNTAHYLKNNGNFPIYLNRTCEYYPQGEDMFYSLKEALLSAKRFIFLDFFIIEKGEMWDSVLDILKIKAKEGVEIRIIYDGTCSVSLLPHNYPKKLKEYGISCKVFSPLTPFVSTHYNNRDHRKIVVIDGECAFTGGVNLADEYINKKERFGHWKDTAIKVTGEAVHSFTLMFLQLWNIDGKDKEYSKYLKKPSTDIYNTHDGFIIPYADSPLDSERVGENIYIDIINTAKDYVHIMTPYLILDGDMITSLRNAASRGVDVRIVIPHIPDHKIAFAIAKSHYYDLVPYGVKIYEYIPGFIHAKVMVSDGLKAVVGTINLDYRSLYLHFECATYIYGASAICDIEKDAAETFAKSHLISPADLKKRGIFSMLFSGVLKLIAPLM